MNSRPPPPPKEKANNQNNNNQEVCRCFFRVKELQFHLFPNWPRQEVDSLTNDILGSSMSKCVTCCPTFGWNYFVESTMRSLLQACLQVLVLLRHRKVPDACSCFIAFACSLSQLPLVIPRQMGHQNQKKNKKKLALHGDQVQDVMRMVSMTSDVPGDISQRVPCLQFWGRFVFWNWRGNVRWGSSWPHVSFSFFLEQELGNPSSHQGGAFEGLSAFQPQARSGMIQQVGTPGPQHLEGHHLRRTSPSK